MTSPITVPCKTCGVDVARTDYPPHRWVHLDDEIVLNGPNISFTHYDHEAIPDVIDVQEVTTKSLPQGDQ